MKKYKIFGIGLPKTGTTTLLEACKILGYENNLPIIDNFDKYNCFIGDSMFFFDYKELDDKYKNAKFILTLRKDHETWFNSVMKWNEKPTVNQSKIIQTNRLKMYGHKFPTFENKQDWINVYINRQIEIINYFLEKNNLLTVCWEQNTAYNNWKVLCNFLNEPFPSYEFPHKNKQNYYVKRNINSKNKL